MSNPNPSQYPGQPGGADPWGPPPPAYDTPPSGYDTPPSGYDTQSGQHTPSSGYGTTGADYYGTTAGGYGTPPGGYAAPPGGYTNPPYSPAGPGQQATQAPPQGTNGLAIASLICGIIAPCGAGILSLIFGIIALVQIRQRRQKGKGLAIAGLVLTGLWAVGAIVAVIVAIATSGADRDPGTGDITSGGNVLVTELQPGDCVNGLEEGTLGLTLPAVPCAEPHEAEVYSVFDVSMDGAWPGEDAVFTEANDRCLADLRDDFPTQYDDDQVDIFYLHPSEATWRGGDREVVCLAFYLDGKRTGSIID